MVETVRKLISTDCQMTLQMMEEELKISKETIRKILMEDLCLFHSALFDRRTEGPQTASLLRVYSMCG
jgi:hypothetical protein